MEQYVSWIQLSVTGLLLAFVLGITLKSGSRVKEYTDSEIRKMREEMRKNDTDNRTVYLTEKYHDTICDNQSYRLKEHVTKSLDPIFAILKTLEKKIDALDGRTHFLKNGNHNGNSNG